MENFVTGQWVLTRNFKEEQWLPQMFGFTEKYLRGNEPAYRYFVFGGASYRECIPYEGNEKLLGTTTDFPCYDFKEGDDVLVTDDPTVRWLHHIFIKKDGDKFLTVPACTNFHSKDKYFCWKYCKPCEDMIDRYQHYI